MKKLIIIFLLFAYGFTAVGASYNIHYCMGRIVESSFYTPKAKACPKCKMPKNKGCCKDEQKQIKISDNQNYHKADTVLFKNLFFDCGLQNPKINTDCTFFVNIINPLFANPPPKQNISLTIINQVFRI